MHPDSETVPRHRDERGQVIVVFAISLVTIILAVGLVIDGGFAFVNRRDAQNTADLAALAGTKVILNYYVAVPSQTATTAGPEVYNAIRANAASNNCPEVQPIPCSWTAQYIDNEQDVLGPVTATAAIPSGAQGVIVDVNRQPRTFFLGVIGQSTWNVNTTATALTATPGGVPPGTLLPIGTNPPTPFTPGSQYTLTTGAPFGPGNFGWLTWFGDQSATTLAASLCAPDNPALSFPIWVPGDTGTVNSSNVRACLNKWISSDATVYIPVFDQYQGNGANANYHIINLAAFVLSGYTTSGGAINSISGSFKKYANVSNVPSGFGGPPSAANSTYFFGLIQ